VWVKSRVTDARVHVADAATIAALYERRPDFVRLDPRGAFRNAWLEARVLGAG
jgi:alditol oxidase